MKYENGIVFWGVLGYLLVMEVMGVVIFGVFMAPLGGYLDLPGSLADAMVIGFSLYDAAIATAAGIWILAYLLEVWREKASLWRDEPHRLFGISVAITLFGAAAILMAGYSLLDPWIPLTYCRTPVGGIWIDDVLRVWVLLAPPVAGILCSKKVHAFLLAHSPVSMPEPGA